MTECDGQVFPFTDEYAYILLVAGLSCRRTAKRMKTGISSRTLLSQNEF
jgi:hypothetical protein